MPYRTYEQRRRDEQRTFNGLVKQLNYELDRYDFDRDETGRDAIGKALNVKNIKDGKYRDGLFGKLIPVMERHPRVKALRAKQDREKQNRADLEAERDRIRRRDAWANQMRQPRDTWDPHAE